MATSTLSLPILSIPAYYVLALYPHTHAVLAATKGDFKTYDNRNPHGTDQKTKLQQRLGPKGFAKYERAENAHRNALENMPLYVAAVFAGYLAEQKAGAGAVGLNTFVGAWFALRIAYTVAFITIESRKWAGLRSLLYFTSTLWAFKVLGQAAFALG